MNSHTLLPVLRITPTVTPQAQRCQPQKPLPMLIHMLCTRTLSMSAAKCVANHACIESDMDACYLLLSRPLEFLDGGWLEETPDLLVYTLFGSEKLPQLHDSSQRQRNLPVCFIRLSIAFYDMSIKPLMKGFLDSMFAQNHFWFGKVRCGTAQMQLIPLRSGTRFETLENLWAFPANLPSSHNGPLLSRHCNWIFRKDSW